MILSRRWSQLLPICSIVAWFAVPATAQQPAAVESVEDVFACVSANAPESTMKQAFELKVHDRGGGVQTLKADRHWKRDAKRRSKILISLSAPPDLRGSSYLMIEGDERNDMFAYLPELRLVRRVTGRHSAGSVFGSDFSYEDMERLYVVSRSGGSKRLPDESVAGREAWVVETRPTGDTTSAYHKTVTWVDRKTCVALKTVFYEGEDEVRKTLLADVASLEQIDGVWIPRRVRIEDRQTATHTELEVGEIAFDVEIPDRMFTRSSLERRGR